MPNWKKRAQNREDSTLLLQQAEVGFTSHNAGAHLIVRHHGLVVNFWPGTGLWRCISGGEGRGVRNLIDWLQRASKAEVVFKDTFIERRDDAFLQAVVDHEEFFNAKQSNR